MTDQSTPKSRRKIAFVTYGALAIVLLGIEAMAVKGQLTFARSVLQLDGAWPYFVPISLEGVTLSAAGLLMWAVMQHDGATMPRLLMWGGMALAISAGVSGAMETGLETAAAVYFGAMSVGALTLFELVLRQLRREDLRAIGAIEAPLPRFRGLRWVVAPGETFRAWRYAVREGITKPSEALSAVRAEVRPAAVTTDGVDLAQVSKSEAWKAAFAEVGDFDVAKALAWLTDRGVKADRSYGYEVRNKLAANRRNELHAVAAGPAKTAKAIEKAPKQRKAAVQ